MLRNPALFWTDGRRRGCIRRVRDRPASVTPRQYLWLQTGQAEAGNAAQVRRRVIPLVNELTAICLETVIDPVPRVADIHVPDDIRRRQMLPGAPLIRAP